MAWVAFDGTTNRLDGFGLSSSTTGTVIVEAVYRYPSPLRLQQETFYSHGFGGQFLHIFHNHVAELWIESNPSGWGGISDGTAQNYIQADTEYTFRVEMSTTGALTGGATLRVLLNGTVEYSSTVAMASLGLADLTLFAMKDFGNYSQVEVKRVTITHNGSTIVNLDDVSAAAWNASTYLQGEDVTEVGGGGGATGTASGSLDLSGSGSGAALARGQGAGALDLAGSGAGAASAAGIGAGGLGLTGAAQGAVPARGAGAGSLGLSGTGTGAAPVRGSGAGALPLSGAATGGGVDMPATGTGAGTLDLSGSGTGAAPARGTGSGSLDLAGQGTGTAPSVGQGGGVLPLSGTGAARAPVTGAGAGLLGLTGQAQGSTAGSVPPSNIIDFTAEGAWTARAASGTWAARSAAGAWTHRTATGTFG